MVVVFVNGNSGKMLGNVEFEHGSVNTIATMVAWQTLWIVSQKTGKGIQDGCNQVCDDTEICGPHYVHVGSENAENAGEMAFQGLVAIATLAAVCRRQRLSSTLVPVGSGHV